MTRAALVVLACLCAAAPAEEANPIHWKAGRAPVQRDTFYDPIRILENATPAEATENSARSKMLEDNLATA